MTSGTDHSTNRQWAEDVSPLTDVREYEMSDKAEATPGPWKVGEREELQNFVRRPIEAGEYGEVVAYVVGTTNPMLDWYAGAKHYEANAHMIAASRDMYDALEATTRELIGERDCLYESVSLPDGSIPDGEDQAGLAEMDRVIDQARSAIKKARGNSHE